LGEVDITVPVPEGSKGRDLNVVIQKKKLSVGLKGKEKIMDGELCQEIKIEESTWTLGKGSIIYAQMSASWFTALRRGQ
jgi:hypothetical protein